MARVFRSCSSGRASKAESTKAELAAYQADLADLGVQVDIRFEHDWPTFLKLARAGATQHVSPLLVFAHPRLG